MLNIAVVVADHFIDSLVTGAFLGVTGMGASGIISQAALVPAAFSGIVSMGLYSACSESIGAKNYTLAGQQISAAFVLVSAVFVPLIIILEVFSDPICALLCQNADANFVATTSAYVRGLAPSLYFSAIIPYLMYSCQMNRKAYWCSISIGALFAINVGGDFFVACCTNLGMLGIGLTTSIGAFVTMLILVGPSISRKSLLHMRWGMNFRYFSTISGKMISFGLPSAVTTLANAFAGMWVNFLLLSTGNYTAVAAYTCASSVVNLLYMPASSLWYCTAITTSVLFGKNMYEAIKRLPAVFTRIALTLTVPAFALAFALAVPLCGVFIPSQPEALDLAITCTYVLAFNLFPNALITCFQSLLRSTEHRIAAVMLPAAYLVVALPLLSWPLAGLFGAAGICAGRVGAYCLGIIGFAVICMARKKTGAFRSSTYVFLKPLADGCAETNCGVCTLNQLEAMTNQAADFFTDHCGDAGECAALPRASAQTLEALFAKTPRETHCWVHTAVKDGKPWMQITSTRKTLDADLVKNLNLDNITASYLDFAMLGAVELYSGEAPYGTHAKKGGRS